MISYRTLISCKSLQASQKYADSAAPHKIGYWTRVVDAMVVNLAIEHEFSRQTGTMERTACWTNTIFSTQGVRML
jgi:hypothetical protein